jgi:hypothetical protein
MASGTFLYDNRSPKNKEANLNNLTDFEYRNIQMLSKCVMEDHQINTPREVNQPTIALKGVKTIEENNYVWRIAQILAHLGKYSSSVGTFIVLNALLSVVVHSIYFIRARVK